MRLHRFEYWMSAAVVLILLSMPSAWAQPQQEERIAQVLRAWKTRQNQPKATSYSVATRAVTPRGALDEEFPGRGSVPPKDIVIDNTVAVLIDLARSRFRIDYEHGGYNPETGEVLPRRLLKTFDGRDFYEKPRRGQPAPPPPAPPLPDVTIGRNWMNGGPLNTLMATDCLPLLYSAGIVYTQALGTRFGQELIPEDFLFHGQGVLDGRSCWILRTIPEGSRSSLRFDEFWVDAQRGFSIVRSSLYTYGRLKVDKKISLENSGGDWIPTRWSSVVFDNGIRVRVQAESRVLQRRADIDASDADFRIPVEPGMIVGEVEMPRPGEQFPPLASSQKLFKVDPSGNWQPLSPAGKTLDRPWPRWYIFATVLTFLATLGVAVVFLRQRRARTCGTNSAARL